MTHGPDARLTVDERIEKNGQTFLTIIHLCRSSHIPLDDKSGIRRYLDGMEPIDRASAGLEQLPKCTGKFLEKNWMAFCSLVGHL